LSLACAFTSFSAVFHTLPHAWSPEFRAWSARSEPESRPRPISRERRGFIK